MGEVVTFFQCEVCGQVSDIEEEVHCWGCGGMMVFKREVPPLQVRRLLARLDLLKEALAKKALVSSALARQDADSFQETS